MATTQKNALITGATSGIGYELAKLFANDGYNLVIVARSQDELNKTVEELERVYKVKVTPLVKDLFDSSDAFKVYEEVKAKGLEIDVLVNNAGHGHYGEFINTDLQMELKIIQLNVASLVILSKLFLKDMVKRGEGKVLNTSSIASKSPGPWQSVYHGTKAFVQSFTEAVREEVKDKGIVITALLPGVTDTDFFRKAGMQSSKIAQDKSKMADPAEVAKDGYDALMSGKDMVISGLKNKIDVALNNITPDQSNAKKMFKRQKPVTQ
jgi:short-subunit dehydrogenase